MFEKFLAAFGKKLIPVFLAFLLVVAVLVLAACGVLESATLEWGFLFLGGVFGAYITLKTIQETRHNNGGEK